MVTPSTGAQYRPYAPPATFLEALKRFRSRNLPEVIDPGYLQAAGASQATASRILGALRFLRLIQEDGTPEPKLRGLVRSPNEEYRETLAGIVRGAYQEIFVAVNPEHDPQAAIMNSFRRAEPASQHYRMTVFFLGLCREAGIPVLDEPRRRNAQPMGTRREGIRNPRAQQTPGREEVPSRTSTLPVSPPLADSMPVALAHSLIRGMVEVLPVPGSPLSKRVKDAWLEAMRLNLDQVYPEEEDPAQIESEHHPMN